MSLAQLKKELKSMADAPLGKKYARFFKTGKGEYGAGDIFIGLRVPVLHRTAKKYLSLNLNQVEKLLQSKIHEFRLTALLILTYKFPKADKSEKKQIYSLYLKNTQYINNWDLVDLSAPKIVGAYLLDKTEKRKILYKLAQSKNLWKQRISVLSTFTFIKKLDFKDALKISKILLHHPHDLIHKAVGWMLREIGKKDQKTEEKFLKAHYQTMPRTMLRYAIEKFSEKKRQFYLKK